MGGYIRIVLCNIGALTSERVSKSAASVWMCWWDVPIEIRTDFGKECIDAQWEDMCRYLGFHHPKARLYDHCAPRADRAGRIILNFTWKSMAQDNDCTWFELVYPLPRKYHQKPNYTRPWPNEVVFGR